MDERYPTPAETQEWLNEIYAADPALWEYIMLGDDERAYLMGEYDEDE